MMKFLYIIPSLEEKGPVIQCLNLIKSIKVDQENILVVSLSGGVLEGEFRKLAGVEVIGLKPVGLIKLFRLFLDFKPSVVHSHCLLPDFINALLKICFVKRARFLTTSHNYLFKDYKFEYGCFKGGLIGSIHLGVFLWLKNVVGCSGSVSNYLSGFGLKKQFVRNAVECKSLCLDTSSYELNLNGFEFTYIYCGPLIERKGIAELISKFEKYESRALVLCGNNIGDYYSERDNIFILGRVPHGEMLSLVRSSDIYVSFSRAEGFPIAALEAASLGCQMLLSDIEPHKEMVDLGIGGIIFEDLMEKDLCLVEDLVNTTEQINVDFLFEDMGKEYLEIYHAE